MNERIVCGWCGEPTPDGVRCSECAHDPRLPWDQRGMPVPTEHRAEGRPALAATDVRSRYGEAKRSIEARGQAATVEALAEALDRSPRTIREWRKRYGLG